MGEEREKFIDMLTGEEIDAPPYIAAMIARRRAEAVSPTPASPAGSERLTDERVREIAEGGEVYIEPLAESDFGRGVGHENWPSKEAVALAREVLAARAGDREEREGMADALDAAWVDGYTTGADPAWCEKQLRRMGRRNEEPHTRRAAQRLLADHAAHRAAPGGETRKEGLDG